MESSTWSFKPTANAQSINREELNLVVECHSVHKTTLKLNIKNIYSGWETNSRTHKNL